MERHSTRRRPAADVAADGARLDELRDELAAARLSIAELRANEHAVLQRAVQAEDALRKHSESIANLAQERANWLAERSALVATVNQQTAMLERLEASPERQRGAAGDSYARARSLHSLTALPSPHDEGTWHDALSGEQGGLGPAELQLFELVRRIRSRVQELELLGWRPKPSLTGLIETDNAIQQVQQLASELDDALHQVRAYRNEMAALLVEKQMLMERTYAQYRDGGMIEREGLLARIEALENQRNQLLDDLARTQAHTISKAQVARLTEIKQVAKDSLRAFEIEHARMARALGQRREDGLSPDQGGRGPGATARGSPRKGALAWLRSY